jgi:tetratricopeptide (TPR) repeat protein/transglutaminase-like putative cysteine protease
MRQRMLVLTLVSVCFAMAADAAEKPLLGPVPGWVRPAPLDVNPATTSAAALQVLLSDQQVNLTPEAVEYYFDNRIRIQTPQGLQAAGTIAIAWQPDADVVTVHRLVVRRGGVTRDLTDGKADSFTVLRREDLLAQATLTGTLTAILQPSDLQVGDIVEFAYTRRHADPVVPDKPDLQFAWSNTPVQSIRFRAQWPKQMAVRWQLHDLKTTLEEASSGSTQSIAFALDNPPPLLQPTGAPARFAAVRRIELTAFQSWQEVSQRFAPLYTQASKLAADSPLRAEIERIRASSADPKTRAAGALRLVQDQIRYVLLAMNSGALVPATADQTWQRRYGDCKAKTALLLALLRELGIEAEPVAVNSAMGDGVDRLLPAIGAFDHVLVRTRIAGRTYWLDGTRLGDRYLDQLEVPHFYWGLPLVASGSALVSIAPTALSEPLVVQEIDVDASAGVDAPAPLRGRIVFRGDSATALRFSLDNLDATQKDQILRNQWRSKFSDLQVSKVESSFDETGGTLTLTVEGTLRMKWIDKDFFEIEDMRLGFDADFSRPDNTDADAPYAVAFPDYSVNRATVKLPAGQSGFGISGDNINQQLAGWEYKRTATVSNNLFRAESSMRSITPEITAKEARAAEANLRKMDDSVLYLTRPRTLPTVDELKSQAGKPLNSASEYNERGASMMDRSLYELAIVEFTNAIRMDPRHAHAWSNRGVSQGHLKNFSEAQADLRKATELDPLNAHAMRYLGSVTLELGQTKDAIELLGKALAIEEHSWARERRARAYAASGNMTAAAKDLVAVSRTDPLRTSHFENRLPELVRDNRRDDLRILAQAALEAPAGPSGGAALSARIYVLAGDVERSRTILAEAIGKAPTPDLYLQLGLIESTPERTIAAAEKALDLDPKFSLALILLGTAYKSQKKFPEALKAVERLESATRPSTQWHQLRAEILVQMGDTAGAKQAYVAARSLAGSGMQLNNLCWSQAINNIALDDALKDCESALAMEPDCVACLDSEGFVLLRMQRYEKAIAVYDKVLASQPTSAESLFGRGIAKLRLGRKQEGDADIAAALKSNPLTERRFAEMGVKP